MNVGKCCGELVGPEFGRGEGGGGGGGRGRTGPCAPVGEDGWRESDGRAPSSSHQQHRDGEACTAAFSLYVIESSLAPRLRKPLNQFARASSETKRTHGYAGPRKTSALTYSTPMYCMWP